MRMLRNADFDGFTWLARLQRVPVIPGVCNALPRRWIFKVTVKLRRSDHVVARGKRSGTPGKESSPYQPPHLRTLRNILT